MNAGVAEYLRKPVGAEELFAAVARAVSSADRTLPGLAPIAPLVVETSL